MSYSTMYTVPHSGPFERLAEFGNSYGLAYRIWDSLTRKYLGQPYVSFPVGKKLWRLAESCGPCLSIERAVITSTFDYAIVRVENAVRLADDLDEFSRLNPTSGVCHLSTVADLLRENATRDDIVGFAFWQTSFSGFPWLCIKRDEENEEEGWHRCFDWSLDKDKGIHITNQVVNKLG